MSGIRKPPPKVPSPFIVKPISASAAENAISATQHIAGTGESAVRDQSVLSLQNTAIPTQAEKLVPAQVLSSSTYQVGGVYDVPVQIINSNPFNPRYVYTKSAVDEMLISLTEHGQRISATGFLDGKGSVVLIEGETRLRASREAGLKTLRVEIKERPLTDKALYEEARAANVERRDQTPLDDAMRWKELLAKKVYDNQRALGIALNVPEDVVSRTLSLTGFNSFLINVVAEYPELLTLKMLVALREFYEVKGVEPTHELILEVAKAGMGARDVTARRKSALNDPIKRPRSVREVIHYGGAKGEIKAFEDEGRVEVSLSGLNAEESAAFTKAVKEILGKS
jgi:ParB family chromosome partitioning protein